MQLNMTLPWFLCNVVQVSKCLWLFQLNGDATFNFCSRVVDMISLGVNYLGAQNHTLCWSLIPKSTEGELVYTGTFKKVQEAVMKLLKVCVCSDASSQCERP